jgi:methionyl-tRNA synthetase
MTMSISYEEFAKLEIRIGTITAVELVEGADRLLKLSVDMGEAEPRQIVSGIREFFSDPQVLIGKQCPFLVNLEPRTIRGLESQGMILAGGEGATFTLLHPGNGVPPGTMVH